MVARTALSEYATVQMYQDNIRYRPTNHFTTPLEKYNALSEEDQRVNNAVKNLINKYPTIFVWHNGEKDTGCQFIGLHIHLMISCPYKLLNSYPYKKMRDILSVNGISTKCQKVVSAQSLAHYMQKKTKDVIGVK